jgi:hypothetical protein
MDSLNINEETKKFPGLDINFSNLNGNLYTAKVLNGNGDIIWSKKFASKINITTETLKASPQGPFDNNKVKKSSTEYIDYDFNN